MDSMTEEDVEQEDKHSIGAFMALHSLRDAILDQKEMV